MNKKGKKAIVVSLFVLSILAIVSTASPGRKECNDRLDNDNDTFIDLADSGCVNRGDNDESNCGDNICEGGETCSSCSLDCGQCDSCADTDGGPIVNLKGTVSGLSNNQPYSYTDFCVSDFTLKEYHCLGNNAYNFDFNCAGNSTGNFTGCLDGACI